MEESEMNRVSDFNYQVKTEEQVTIEVDPIGTGPLIVASLDGDTLSNVGSPDTPIYRFSVTNQTGQIHAAGIAAKFSGSDDSARYELRLVGSNGGNFTLPSIRKADPLHEIELIFDVV